MTRWTGVLRMGKSADARSFVGRNPGASWASWSERGTLLFCRPLAFRWSLRTLPGLSERNETAGQTLLGRDQCRRWKREDGRWEGLRDYQTTRLQDYETTRLREHG